MPLSHVNLGTDDLGRAVAFYDRVLAPLGLRRYALHEDEGYAKYTEGGAGYTAGGSGTVFFIGHPFDGGRAGVGRGTCCVFAAEDRAEVRNFAEAVAAAGGAVETSPADDRIGRDAFFICTARDPDGNLIGAAFQEDMTCSAT